MAQVSEEREDRVDATGGEHLAAAPGTPGTADAVARSPARTLSRWPLS